MGTGHFSLERPSSDPVGAPSMDFSGQSDSAEGTSRDSFGLARTRAPQEVRDLEGVHLGASLEGTLFEVDKKGHQKDSRNI